jgi:adenine-specific DNA-methyltransferase
MEKLKMHSPNQMDANIARIRELFPNCVTEAKDEQGVVRYAVDFDQLRQELSDHVVDGPQERYRLDWPGKREALLTANMPISKTLRPSRNDSVDFDSTKNLFIEGDNLEALKALQETYLGKIMMIYIDPPYNTGSDFLYRDNFTEAAELFDARSGHRDEAGLRLVANPDTHGRFHSNWLSMIYPRLKLARNLLRDDGVIFISIDDNEVHNLRKVGSEIFGDENFIAEMVWEGAGKNDARQIGVNHEYVLVFAKNRNATKREWSVAKVGVEPIMREVQRLKKEFGDDFEGASDAMANWYKANKSTPSYAHRRYRYIDKNGLYKEENPTQPGGRKIDLKNPATGETIKLTKGRGWGFDQAQFEDLVRRGRISFISSDSIMLRLYLHETDSVTPQSVFYQPTRSASERLSKLLGTSIFDFPKDETTIQSFIEMASSGDDIVMDFFAGSATTAHAVFLQNATDGGTRRFILVQFPEPVKDGEFSDIAELGKERIKRAGAKVKADAPGASHLDLGFRVLKIDSSNMADVYYNPDAVGQDDLLGAVDNIKPGRDVPEDLLFQVLVDWGVDVALPIRKEAIGGKSIFFVNNEPYDLMACFDRGVSEDLVKKLAKYKPVRMVFRDNGFESDAVKINVEQIFRQLSPSTEVKAI